MRDIVNWELLEIEYNEKMLKSLYNHMDILYKSAECGCSTSMSVLADLSNGLYIKGLEDIERECIVMVLIESRSQSWVAEMVGMSQRMVSYTVAKGIRKIKEYLNKENDNDNRNQKRRKNAS